MALKMVIASLWPVTSVGFSSVVCQSVGSSRVLVGGGADVSVGRNHMQLRMTATVGVVTFLDVLYRFFSSCLLLSNWENPIIQLASLGSGGATAFVSLLEALLE
jgi:hypothetical protein